MNDQAGKLRLAFGQNFTFINLSNPQESRAVIARKIRTQATTFSHRDPARKTKSSHKKRRRAGKHASANSKEGHDVRNGDSASLLFAKQDRKQLVATAARNAGTRERQMLPEGGKGDPFKTFPVAYLPWFDWVLEFYRTQHLPPGIQVVQRTPQEGHAYIDWHLREAMSEPCFFYMQLLNACTPLVTKGRLTQEVVLWLRGQVVSTLNEAIREPKRMLSIPVLLTVASIALHERLYGDVKAALEIHGRAFARMVSLVGGIEGLDMPRIGHVLVKFTDDVLSATNAQKSTTQLLNEWAPNEMREKHPGYDSSHSTPDAVLHSLD